MKILQNGNLNDSPRQHPGGGIAGLALWLWLDKLGITPVVIDHADRFLLLGRHKKLKGNGVDVIRQMGLLAMARARDSRFTPVQSFDPSGKPLHRRIP